MTVSLLPRAEAYTKSVTPTACDKDDLRFTEKNDYQRSHTQRTRDKELTLAVKIFGCGFTPTACDEDIVTVIVKTSVKICDKDAAPTIVTACDSTLFYNLK